MEKVTKENLFSEARNNVVTLIEANVSDPVISSSEYRKWIYSRRPGGKASDFDGYPYIVVHPTDVDVEDGGSVDGKSKVVSWTIEIEIVASDRGYGDHNGQGLAHIDAISDSLIAVFLDMTNRATLSANSLKFSKPTTTAVTTEAISNELVYSRSILLPFRTRMAVSA